MNISEEFPCGRTRLNFTRLRSMHRASARKLSLLPLCISLLMCCSGSALAQYQSSFDQDNRREYVADLKQTAFQQLADLGALEMQSNHPDAARASVYINIPDNDISLQSLKVSLAGRVLAEYHYTDAESASLKNGSQHRVLRTTLNAQREPVVVEFTAKRSEEAGSGQSVKGAVQAMLNTRHAPLSVVMPITSAAFNKTQNVSLEDATASNQNGRPELGMAKFMRASGDKRAAMNELLTMARSSKPSRSVEPAYYLELARSHLDFGMHEHAVANVRKALGAGADWRDVHPVSLQLVELDSERNYDARAYRLLQFLASQNLSKAQLLRLQDIQSRMMMSGGEFERACEVLGSAETDLESNINAESVYTNIMYMRFNYATCLLKTKEIGRGWQLMQRIGRTTKKTPEMLGLRDYSNLLLGYHFLSASQNSPVKEAVQRIRLDSPFRAEALLVLGWMELASGGREPPEKEADNGGQPSNQKESPAPTNQQQQDTASNAIQYNPFNNTPLPSVQTDRANAAIAVWQEIIKEFSQGTAAQEAVLGIPFALSLVGENQSAYAAYQRAVDYLEQSHQRLSENFRPDSLNVQDIGSGDLSDVPNASWVTQALAGHKFQEHLQNTLELEHLHNAIKDLESRYRPNGAPEKQQLQQLNSLKANLVQQITLQTKLAREVFSKALKKQIAKLEKYIAAARLGVVASEEWQDTQ